MDAILEFVVVPPSNQNVPEHSNVIQINRFPNIYETSWPHYSRSQKFSNMEEYNYMNILF